MGLHLLSRFKGGGGECCKKLAHDLTCGIVAENNGYFFQHKDGFVEYASLGNELNDERFVGRKESKGASVLSSRFLVVISAVSVFLLTWCLDIIGVVTGLSFWINIVVLGTLIAPYVLELKVTETSAILGVVLALSVLLLPIPFFLQVAFSLVVATSGFYKLASPSQNTYLAPVLISQVIIAYLVTLAPVALLLAPLPVVFTFYKARSARITCKFALTFSVLAMLGAALTTHMLGLGPVICLHDAVLASVIMFAKDVATSMYVPKNNKFIVGVGPEVMLARDTKILESKNLVINLDSVAGERVDGHKGGELKYEIDKLNNIIPAGAHVRGEFVGELLSNSRSLTKDDEKTDAVITDLDRLVSHLVPVFIIAALFAGIWVGVSAGSLFAGATIAMKTLVAGCPCIFLVLPYFEKRMASVYAGKGSVNFNFRAKLLSSYSWPSFLESGFSWLFDRTRTTHFPQKDSDDYAMHSVPKALFAQLKEQYNIDVISGSGAHYGDSTKSDFEGATIHMDSSYSYRENKTKKFHELNGSYTVMFGDGDNDAGVMSDSRVLGIGYNPHPALQGRYTAAIFNWNSWRADEVVNLVKSTLRAQKFANLLLVEILMVLTGMIVLPIGAWQFSLAVPMWSGCVVMIGSMVTMTAQIEYYRYKHHFVNEKADMKMSGQDEAFAKHHACQHGHGSGCGCGC